MTLIAPVEGDGLVELDEFDEPQAASRTSARATTASAAAMGTILRRARRSGVMWFLSAFSASLTGFSWGRGADVVGEGGSSTTSTNRYCSKATVPRRAKATGAAYRGASVTTVWNSPSSPQASTPAASSSGIEGGVEAATEKALVETVGVDDDDRRGHAGGEQLVEQGAARLEPQRQAGPQAGHGADALDPVTVRLQVDVAEHADFGAQLAQFGEAVEKGGLVGRPTRRCGARAAAPGPPPDVPQRADRQGVALGEPPVVLASW